MPGLDLISINVSLDLFGAVVMLILLLYLFLFSRPRKNMDWPFMLMCIGCLMMLLGDIPNWLCAGLARPWYPAAQWWGILIQYAGGVVIPFFYTLYIKAYLTPKVRLNTVILRIVGSLTLLSALLVGVNLFSGIFYVIDVGNIYHRGPWWLVSQITPVVIACVNAGVVLYYRRHMRLKDVCSFLAYNVLVLIAIILQSMFYGLALTYPAITVAILIIFLNIQSEQALLLQERENELEKGRVAIMLSQIQPHFLYNTIGAISELCLLRPQEASTALVDFAAFLRGNMDSLKRETPIPFEAELCHTKTYLALEKMRFDERLHIVYDIRATHFRVPSLSLQPMVENAVHYGIGRREAGGTVSISSYATEDGFVVEIADDGVGFDPELPLSGERTHVGIENVRNRMKLQCCGALEIESRMGRGTTVRLRFPPSAAME